MKGMNNLVQKSEGGGGLHDQMKCKSWLRMMQLAHKVEADLKRPTTNTITLLLNE
jgi:hypothetical protein